MSGSYKYSISFDNGFNIGSDERLADEKGTAIVVAVEIRKVTSTQVETSNGETIYDKFTEPVCCRPILHITSSTLEDIRKCRLKLVRQLVDRDNLDISMSKYLVSRVIPRALELVRRNKDNKYACYILKGILQATRVDVLGLKHVPEVLKKESLLQLPHGDDEDCSICLMKLPAGTGSEGIVRTPCSHVFRYNCILPWVIEKTGCPNCRRIVSLDL